MTQTQTLPRGIVLHQHGHVTRLRAAVRTSYGFVTHPLKAAAPDYEGARAEAEAKFGFPFLVPRLGELS